MSEPYLSIVLTGRNDDYGGDFRLRLQNCVNNAVAQLTNERVDSELIFVNYNPLANPPIEEFIDWPSSNEYVKIRLLTVPGEVHEQLVSDGSRKNVPVLEYLGKNAGIRRAKGQFILSMNPDIILSSAVVKNLGELKRECYYRADRIDFKGDIFGAHDFTTVFLRGHGFQIRSLDSLQNLRIRNAFMNWWKLLTPSLEWLLNPLSVPVYYNNVGNRFHCNVSGDFMLMHRDAWFELHGHHENRPISLHVDSLMVVQAAVLGLKEVVFKEPIYHQEHERRYDATKGDAQFVEAFQYFTDETNEMLKNSVPNKYNDVDWGLSGFDLPEIEV